MGRIRIALLIVAMLTPAQLLAATLVDALTLCRDREYAAAALILDGLASRGDPDAQTWLAWLYDAGAGVPRDPVRAASLYDSAARKGIRLAQITLATKYWKGDGVEKDLLRGNEWMRKAAANDQSLVELTPGGLSATGYRRPMIARHWYSTAQIAPKTKHHKRLARVATRVAQY
jgi:uncharacterized protein